MRKAMIIFVSIFVLVVVLGIVKICIFGFQLKSSIDYYIKAHTNYVGTTGEYADKTEKLLEEKYGEKFKVVQYGNNRATVYPESDPNLLFTARRYAVSEIVDDDYIQEIVGLQYKKLAEDVLKDFKYDYYLDVDLPFTYDPIDADQNVTIEEFKKVFPKKVEPKYNLYVSLDAIKMSDEELYELVNSIALIPEQDNCTVVMYFVNETYKEEVLENYKNYSYIEPSFYNYVLDNRIHVSQFLENNELSISFERFKEIKEETRKNNTRSEQIRNHR